MRSVLLPYQKKGRDLPLNKVLNFDWDDQKPEAAEVKPEDIIAAKEFWKDQDNKKK